MSRLLIVNADDYGLTESISRGILAAHRDGVVTSTSVLAVGPALPCTAGWLSDEPRLGIGAHLALVGEDPPVLSRREVPSLVTRTGRFPLTWRAFLARAVTGRVDPADVAREFEAQLDRLERDCRLRLTHIDTHQHLHLWPAVASIVVTLARKRGIPAVRVPASAAPGPKGTGIRRLSRRLAARAHAAGLHTPDAYGGLDEAGRLSLRRLVTTVERLAATGADTAEINCHPAMGGGTDRRRYAWDYQWEAELAALTSRRARDTIERHGFALGCYADLSPRGAR